MRSTALTASLLIALAACGRGAAAPTKAQSQAERTQPAQPQPPVAPPRPLERVVIVSVDGLRPSDCAKLPTLGHLARESAFAAPPEGALSVLPTVTYPAHTSMVTGVDPRRHGIIANAAADPTPEGKNKSAWRWFRADVRVPTIYDLAFDAGLRTVLLQWPVTVGARGTAVLPEFWVNGISEDIKVIRALSTPGLFERIEQRAPGFGQRFDPDDVLDAALIDAAIALLADVAPNLMLVHIAEVDGKQHEFGPDSKEAETARKNADAQVARLLEALRARSDWPRTVLVIVSDHGFLRVNKELAPLVHLAADALLERVWMITAGSTAFFYLYKPDDAEAAARTREIFERLAQDPAKGVATVLDREAIAARGGDADAFLAIEAAPGFSLSRSRSGKPITKTAANYKGTHGFLPERPEMRATLLFHGPQVAPAVLHGARLIDLAPTIAPWLGLQLDKPDGVPLLQLNPPRAQP